MSSNKRKTSNGENGSDYWTPDGDSIVDKEREKKGKCGGRCRNILKHIFSHVGITGMVIAYAIIGGFIFQHLEQTNEKQECIQLMEKYVAVENKTMYNIWEISKVYVDEFEKNAGDEALKLKVNAITEFGKILSHFQSSVLDLSYDGKNCTIMGETGGPGFRWSFAGSLLFAVTVITSIGKFCHWCSIVNLKLLVF